MGVKMKTWARKPKHVPVGRQYGREEENMGQETKTWARRTSTWA
ncbi:hypothetical protein [Lentibacillus sp. CBA3610]|nr:hypothetical protein [Lentibacillus sp. CBA3610]